MLEKRLHIKRINCKGYDRLYITLDTNGINEWGKITSLYEKLIQYIRENQVRVVYQKSFGKLDCKNELRKSMIDYISRFNIKEFPYSYIEAHPFEGTYISSITIYGILLKDASAKISYFCSPLYEKVVGTVLQLKASKFLYLIGLNDALFTPGDIDEKYSQLFDQIGEYISANGFNPDMIFRTWIYLRDIDNNYPALNKRRREFFDRFGINYDTEAENLPASTCIEGVGDDKSNCDIDLVCLSRHGEEPILRRVYNSLQNEAEGSSYLYRPTFSRAMAILDTDYTELQISGTASIDTTGKTIHIDDYYNQIKKTLLNVQNLLQQFNMDFEDIVQSTCFFKKEEYYDGFVKAVKELGISNFSNTYVVSNVCRDDLLFELDGIAIKGA